jgi:hypothetical protein
MGVGDTFTAGKAENGGGLSKRGRRKRNVSRLCCNFPANTWELLTLLFSRRISPRRAIRTLVFPPPVGPVKTVCEPEKRKRAA